MLLFYDFKFLYTTFLSNASLRCKVAYLDISPFPRPIHILVSFTALFYGVLVFDSGLWALFSASRLFLIASNLVCFPDLLPTSTLVYFLIISSRITVFPLMIITRVIWHLQSASRDFSIIDFDK